MTTGGKGVHVVAPLTPRADWARLRAFTGGIARALEAADPSLFVAKATKSARESRIFVDWLRNGRGATAIAPFAPRARAGAPVAMPIGWNELARVRPDQFKIGDVARRLARQESDPWQGYFDLDQSVSAAAVARLESAVASGRGARRGGEPGVETERSSEMAAKKKSAKRAYGPKASEKVERAMHERKRGKLRSSSGQRVTSRKQAIAIGLSEARAAGGKVPARKRSTKKSAKKSAKKRGGRKASRGRSSR
jgi:hypothetical protein